MRLLLPVVAMMCCATMAAEYPQETWVSMNRQTMTAKFIELRPGPVIVMEDDKGKRLEIDAGKFSRGSLYKILGYVARPVQRGPAPVDAPDKPHQLPLKHALRGQDAMAEVIRKHERLENDLSITEFVRQEAMVHLLNAHKDLSMETRWKISKVEPDGLGNACVLMFNIPDKITASQGNGNTSMFGKLETSVPREQGLKLSTGDEVIVTLVLYANRATIMASGDAQPYWAPWIRTSPGSETVSMHGLHFGVTKYEWPE